MFCTVARLGIGRQACRATEWRCSCRETLAVVRTPLGSDAALAWWLQVQADALLLPTGDTDRPVAGCCSLTGW